MKNIKRRLKNLGNILLVSTPLLVPLAWEGADSLAFERTALNKDYDKTTLLNGDKFYVLAKSKNNDEIQLRGNLTTEYYYDTNGDKKLDKCDIYAITGMRAGIAGKVKEYNLKENPEKFQKIQKIIAQK